MSNMSDWFGSLVEKQHLLMISKRHAFVLCHVTGHPWQDCRVSRVHIVLLFEIILNLSYLKRGIILLDFDKGEKLADYFFLLIGQDEPVSLASG